MNNSTPPVKMQSGFSLIELMIAVAIVGILAAIAFPSYKQYVVRSNRADAQQTLLQAAQEAERYFVANNSYVNYAVSTGLTKSPPSGTTIYNLSATAATASSFKIKATPSATATNKSDGFMTIDSTGQKEWDRNNDGSIGAGETTWTN